MRAARVSYFCAKACLASYKGAEEVFPVLLRQCATRLIAAANQSLTIALLLDISNRERIDADGVSQATVRGAIAANPRIQFRDAPAARLWRG
jgi:hypothetical protein